MMQGPDAEEKPSPELARPGWLKRLGRRLSVPLALLLSLLVFLTAVGIDSLQQAAAADMTRQSTAFLQANIQQAAAQSAFVPNANRGADVTGTYLEFDETTASRLGRSDLIGSQLTRSRLTRSHLLLRSPR